MTLRAHFEEGADGKPQMVIPGTEKASHAEMAQRLANAPMRPKTLQRPPGGLWDYEGEQLDLVEMFMDSTEEE